MEVNKFQLVAHFLFFTNLIIGFDDLSGQGLLFIFVFFNQSPFLSLFFQEKFLYSIGFDVTSSAIFSSH